MCVGDRMMVPMLVTFIVDLILKPMIVPFLEELGVKRARHIRNMRSRLGGTKAPAVKNVVVLTTIIVASLFCIGSCPGVVPMLFLAMKFKLVKFLSSCLGIIVGHSSKLFPVRGVTLRVMIATVFTFCVMGMTGVPLAVVIPFSNNCRLGLK